MKTLSLIWLNTTTFFSKLFSYNPSKASLNYLVYFVLQWVPKRKSCILLNRFTAQGVGRKTDLLAVSLQKFKSLCSLHLLFYLNYTRSRETKATNSSFGSDPVCKLGAVKAFLHIVQLFDRWSYTVHKLWNAFWNEGCIKTMTIFPSH